MHCIAEEQSDQLNYLHLMLREEQNSSNPVVSHMTPVLSDHASQVHWNSISRLIHPRCTVNL